VDSEVNILACIFYVGHAQRLVLRPVSTPSPTSHLTAWVLDDQGRKFLASPLERVSCMIFDMPNDEHLGLAAVLLAAAICCYLLPLQQWSLGWQQQEEQLRL